MLGAIGESFSFGFHFSTPNFISYWDKRSLGKSEFFATTKHGNSNRKPTKQLIQFNHNNSKFHRGNKFST